MASEQVGTMNVRLLVQVGTADPHILGSVQVPITTQAPALKRLEVDLEQVYQTVAVMLANVFGDTPADAPQEA